MGHFFVKDVSKSSLHAGGCRTSTHDYQISGKFRQYGV